MLHQLQINLVILGFDISQSKIDPYIRKENYSIQSRNDSQIEYQDLNKISNDELQVNEFIEMVNQFDISTYNQSKSKMRDLEKINISGINDSNIQQKKKME